MSKQLRSMLVKFPSLKLKREFKCARRVRGHLVVSFTIQRCRVMRIRVSELHHTLLCIPCSCHRVMGNQFLSTMCQCLQWYFPYSPNVQFRPPSFCLALLRCIAHLVKEVLAQSVSVMPSVVLCGLLLQAGDVEVNPGSIQGKEMAPSGQSQGSYTRKPVL